MHFNYNGKISANNDAVIPVQSRGLRFGDGLFETMKLKNGSLILADEHFARLWKGMQLLQFDIPKLFTPEKLIQEIISLAAKNKLKSARVRITVIRSEGGLFDAKNHLPNYIIETSALASDTGLLNGNGLQICLYPDAAKSIDRFSNIKHNNYLPYFMGAIFAKQQQCNDAVILNSKGNICDSSIANIFMVKDGAVFTPALTEGCVAGVMRKWLIEKMREQELSVDETVVTVEMLKQADECFMSNSIYNVRWAASFEEKKYNNAVSQKIVAELQKKYPEIYC